MGTFSEAIKEEITGLELDKQEAKALLSSFFTNTGKIFLKENEIIWNFESSFNRVIRFIKQLFDQCYDINSKISYSELNKFNKHRTYRLSFVDKEFEQVVNELEIISKKRYPRLTSKKTQKAYLAGAFISGGSINDISKSTYHLEIRSSKIDYLRNIQTILNKHNISITLLKRKYNYTLYIKKANEISDFLKLIGAKKAMFGLEDSIISRDFYNQIHRLNNLDISNLIKTVKCNEEQIKMIKKISKTDIYQKQKNKFKFFCILRVKNPSLSLNEISKLMLSKYKIKTTRTGTNHHVMKLRKIYKEVN